MKRIYFDHASTTPVDPAVIEAMAPFWAESFGNAASPHGFGQEARQALDNARQAMATALGATAGDVVLTSGATESNNQAVFGVARALRNRGRHLIVSRTEHHSVIEPAEVLARDGYDVTWLTPDPEGRLDPAAVKAALRPDTILIAVQHASNEIGTIQPAAEIGAVAREARVPYLLDAVQTVGHLPVHAEDLNADLMSFSAHKFYGPKGVGGLYIRRGTPVSSLLYGGSQENGLRASTQNVAGVIGMAKALELALERMTDEALAQAAWRDRLFSAVPELIPGVKINGHRTQRLPNNAHFAFPEISSESLLLGLDMAGIAASMGSACSAGALEPSHVVRAIGLPDELAMGALRISLGRSTTEEDIDYFLQELPTVVGRLRV